MEKTSAARTSAKVAVGTGAASMSETRGVCLPDQVQPGAGGATEDSVGGRPDRGLAAGLLFGRVGWIDQKRDVDAHTSTVLGSEDWRALRCDMMTSPFNFEHHRN